MARKSTVTPEQRAYVEERRRKGIRHSEIAAELKAKGMPLSTGTVHAIAPGPDAARKRRAAANAPSGATPSPRAAKPAPVAPDRAADAVAELAGAVEAASAGEGTDLLPLLRRQVTVLEELADVARAEGNLSGFAALSRVVNATAALVAKLQPPPPPDPNANPDMMAAAKAAREKLHDLIDRALAEEPE